MRAPFRGVRWRQSLRVRLVLLFMLLAMATAAIFMGGVKRAFTSGMSDATRPMIVDYADRLVAELGTPPDVERARQMVERLPITLQISGPQVNWSSIDEGHRRWHSGRIPEHALVDENGEDAWFVRRAADGHRVVFGWSPRLWRVVPHATGWYTLAGLLAMVALAYALVHRLLRPLIDIREGAERFGRGEFAAPIPVRRADDLGELAQRINTMALEIQAMLDAKRALLLAMSHELRSPLTRARLNAELLPEQGEGAAERTALLRDLNEMRELINDLLESERLASPHVALQREPVDLPALVREVADELAARGGAHATLAQLLTVEAATGSNAPPALALDRARVRLLLRNLIDNALRHGGGTRAPAVRLAATAEGGVAIEVRDFGAGVPEDQLARLAEPFYRPDSARARSAGGVGLGLYLCQLVAQAHGGRLALRNAQPGLAVTACLMPQ
ncbi:ATP-binding protein [Xenophilus arseniciresistens]|uniref:histidine kinase n=1 Tax=Xenophilus arseniciresistens TaxID=1283306 RepID=A0AAE3NCR7_9BURK|nr:sensor histidine kinase [Xenophilus arseniciresistens]MDA7418828.1 ATP-binding protein [Xenophilus arseniciresistens]